MDSRLGWIVRSGHSLVARPLRTLCHLDADSESPSDELLVNSRILGFGVIEELEGRVPDPGVLGDPVHGLGGQRGRVSMPDEGALAEAGARDEMQVLHRARTVVRDIVVGAEDAVEPSLDEGGHRPPVDRKENDGHLGGFEQSLLPSDVGGQLRTTSVVRQIRLSVDRVEAGSRQIMDGGGRAGVGPDSPLDGPRNRPGRRVVVRVCHHEEHLRSMVFVRHVGQAKV